jgi:hypothetical protein
MSTSVKKGRDLGRDGEEQAERQRGQTAVESRARSVERGAWSVERRERRERRVYNCQRIVCVCECVCFEFLNRRRTRTLDRAMVEGGRRGRANKSWIRRG